MTRIPFLHIMCVAYLVTTSLCFSAAAPEECREQQAQFVLWGNKAGELKTLALSFSPDGKQLASGGEDFAVSIWDHQTGRQLHRLDHDYMVRCLSYSPDGRQLASGGAETLRIWDPENGRQLHVLHQYKSEDFDSSSVYCLSYSPDGRQLASGGDCAVCIWDREGSLLRILRTYDSSVSSLSYSPDGRQLASGGVYCRVHLWDSESGKLLNVLNHSGVRCLSYSPDGRQLASASDEDVVICDPQNGQQLHRVRGHCGYVECLNYSPDGRQLASGGCDSRVCIWDSESGRKLYAHKKCSEGWIHCLRYSPDGRRLASGSSAKTVRVWDPQSGRKLYMLKGNDQFVSCLSFSPDGSQMASGSGNGKVCIWNMPMSSQGQGGMPFLERVGANARQHKKTVIKEGSKKFLLFNALPASIRRLIQENVAIIPGNWQCSICFDGREGKTLVATRCNHLFHEDCLARWQSEGNTTCPYCSRPIS